MTTATKTSLRSQMVAAGARWSAGQRDLVRLAAQLDASGEWALDRAASCAHWIARSLDVEVSTAREWLRVGRALADLPAIDAAFNQGQLSYSKVRALTRLANSENETELCTLAQRVPAGRLGHALAAWLTRHETPQQTDARHHEARGMTWRLDPFGMVSGWFRLPPLEAAALTNAVDAGVTRRFAHASADASRDETGRWPTIAQQRADALLELLKHGTGSLAIEIVVHVRGDGCTLDDGTPVAESVVARIAPASFLRALVHDANGRPVNASSAQRHPTLRQRRVVQARDRACVDCGATEFLEFDHDPPFEETERTVVGELYLRCRDCHRARHQRLRAADRAVANLGEFRATGANGLGQTGTSG